VTLSIERKVSLGFAAALAVLLLVGVAAWRNAVISSDTFRLVDHTRQVLTRLGEVQTDVLAMQSSARGFVLLGREEILATYETGATRIGDTLQRLRRITADNPVQQRALTQLDPLIAEAGAILRERIAARRTRGPDSAADTAPFLSSQQTVDRIRALIAAMEQEEEQLLHARIAAAEHATRTLLATIAAVCVAATGLVTLALLILRRDWQRRQQAETERDRSVVELRASESRYRALFDSMDEGYCIIEMLFDENEKPVDYRFLEVNGAFEKHTGLADARGKRMREIAPLHEAHWFEIYGRIALTGESQRFQNRAEQLHRWYDVYAFRYGDPARREVAILFTDISARRAAEEKLATLNASLQRQASALEAANAELEAFSYSVSHDLRAPLRHVHGFSRLLEEHAGHTFDEKGRRLLHTIRDAAKQMGTLIDDLLAFSRAGRTPLRPAPVAHDALLAAVIRDGHFENDGRRLNWELHPLPEVEADAAMLRQVWANLVDNAVKYSRKTPQPRIAIGCLAVDGAPVSERVFYVRDNGVGFDMAYAGKLFGVFQRLHGPAEFEGTGIGLANVRRIVARHGGRTWAEGRVGEGATFFFSLPVAHATSALSAPAAVS
jgi:PAS domain S-box-containing protein